MKPPALPLMGRTIAWVLTLEQFKDKVGQRPRSYAVLPMKPGAPRPRSVRSAPARTRSRTIATWPAITASMSAVARSCPHQSPGRRLTAHGVGLMA